MSTKAIDIDKRLVMAASQRPGALALTDGRSELSWAGFDKCLNQLANALIQKGIQPGDKIAALSRNSLQYVLLFFATIRAGACIVPLSTLASRDSIIGMIEDSDASILFLSEEFADFLCPETAQFNRLQTEDIVPLNELGIARFQEGAPARRATASYEPETGFNLIYSSGTTGTPKGILQDRNYRNLEARDIAASMGLDGDSRTIVSTPLYSNTTLFLFISVLAAGGSAWIMNKFDTQKFADISRAFRPSHQVLVPVQYERLLRQYGDNLADLSSYDAKFCTSAPLRAEVKRQILDKWPAGGLTEFYGMTEGGVAFSLVAHEHPDKLDTVGTPFSGCEIQIIDEKGRPLAIGETGEIVGRSPKMMRGYHNRPTATENASWYDASGQRFLKSGDIGWLDEDGFLHLLDRKKDVIISGGFNIYAVDIEKILLSFEEVLEAAVVGAPDETWGETPVAFIVAAAETALDTSSLLRRANQKLGKGQRISEIVVTREMPRSPIGKILKRELRERYAAA